MVKHGTGAKSKGIMRKSRSILTKNVRDRGMTPITHTMRHFDEGDKAAISIDPGIHDGMPHHKYNGTTGIVTGKQGNCFVVAIKDGNKPKTLIVRAEHLRKV
ncbi:MAG: 50S ribosomal protein L21e [Thermoplasmata archaeon HGW-Thermoplasmata-2]|nr:MAG: 50S ribosomal protein L21e [Thermoplasmata archaeon HGW-Thermoplasmata-2]